jgi:dienelactone hydrolase
MERRMAPRTPKLDPSEARLRLIELARAYNAGTLGLPSPFFPQPAPVAMTATAQGDGPHGTQVVDLAWPSEYEAFLPAAREQHRRSVENATARTRWWTSGKGRPTIVTIHGWGGGNQWIEQRAFTVGYWLKHGFDVASFVLPFHGERTAGQSGASFPSPNPLRTNEAFGQAIFDLRALAAFLRQRGASAIGPMGMSLGGYTTALWASVDPTLDFAVAIIPAVSFAKLMWRHGEHSPERKAALAAGVTEDLLVDAFAVHAPTTRPAQLARARLAVIAGRGDRITGPEQAEELAAHWGIAVRWFDGGHLAQIGRSEALRDVRRQLGALDLPGRAFRG